MIHDRSMMWVSFLVTAHVGRQSSVLAMKEGGQNKVQKSRRMSAAKKLAPIEETHGATSYVHVMNLKLS